jgi:hypothetical protein
MELVEPEANCQLQKSITNIQQKLQRHLAVFRQTPYAQHVYKSMELVEPDQGVQGVTIALYISPDVHNGSSLAPKFSITECSGQQGY